MRISRVAILAVGALFLGGSFGASAPAVEVPVSKLNAVIYAVPAPPEVPLDRRIPIGLRLGGAIATVDGQHAPALRSATFSFEGGVGFRSSGAVAGCSRALVESGSAARCDRAIAGSGAAEIENGEGASIPVSLVAYHGTGGTANSIRFFIVISHKRPDESENVVTRLTIQPTAEGVKATWSIPALLNGGGSIVDFNLLLKRRLEGGAGRGGHFLYARCPRGKLQSHAVAQFRDEIKTGIGDQQITASTISTC